MFSKYDGLGISDKYRAMVGPPEMFDIIGAQQFCVMVKNGLRHNHRLFDFGCGCLRAGRFFIPYLDPGKYIGLEPDKELLQYGLLEELGTEMSATKYPIIYTWDDFVFANRMYGNFDYMLAHSIITHAGPDVVKKIFDGAGEVVVDGGKFLGTYFDGFDDCLEDGWHGHEAVTYRKSTITDVATNAGFVSLETKDYGHPMRQTWFIAKK